MEIDRLNEAEIVTSAVADRSECTGEPSRREFIRSLVIALAGAGLAPGAIAGQVNSPSPAAKLGRIDVHYHMLPPFYQKIRRAEPTGIGSSRSTAMRDWTPAMAVDAMNKNGIAAAILSLPVGGVSFNGPGAKDLARASNEYAAKMVADYPGRFGFFASLPLPDQEGSLRELAYAFDVLKTDGIALLTDYGDKWPGDPDYVPVFEQLNRRNAVVFVHPTVPSCCGSLVPGVTPSMTEYLFDTTRAITSFLVNGTFARFPNVRFIFCHSGGTVTVLANRINTAFPKELTKKMQNGVLGELGKLYFDVANATSPAPLSALTALVPPSQILFGSDYPFVPIETTIAPLDGSFLTRSEQQAINRKNAERLFPRFRTNAGG